MGTSVEPEQLFLYLTGHPSFKEDVSDINMEKERFEFYGYDLTEWKEKLDNCVFSEVIFDIAFAIKGREYIEKVIEKINAENNGIESALEINLRTFLKSKDNDFYEQKRYMN